MKNTVAITLDDRKIFALKNYLEQKNSSLEDEVSKFAEQLYIKSVPQSVRDFIDMEARYQGDNKPKNPSAKANHTA